MTDGPSFPTLPPLEEPPQENSSGHAEEQVPAEATRVHSAYDDHPGAEGTETVPVSAASDDTTIGEQDHPTWKDKARTFGISSRKIAAGVQNFEPMQAMEWANRTFQKQGIGLYGTAFTIAVCAWFLADILAIVGGKYVPEPPATRLTRNSMPTRRARSFEEYGVVFSRNLFSSAGKIPGEDNGSGGPVDQGGAPTRTTLPFNLVGTLILRDELRSIATIEDKSASMVYPVRVEDEIPSKAKIVKIEAYKVIFVNTSTGRREFIDIPEDVQVGGPKIQIGKPSKAAAGPGIEKVSENQYNVSRTEVDATLKDLNKVLTEARAVPNFENGVPNGYKLFQIVPGSIYDKLGLQNGDVITGLNGEPINDPARALALLNELKNSSHLDLQIKKDGRVQSRSYDIR
jgi:general secretion pathway protein C